MKVLCKFCENSCKKFGKVECADYNNPTIEDLDKERKLLLVSKENPERLQELQNKLDYFNYGIVNLKNK
jgi:hypothetical protein